MPSSAQGERLLDLVRVMARLRGPDGCPWDLEQDHRTLARHLLEEAHEVLEAIDEGDPERLREELGDLLLQVVFHAQMAADAGSFDVDDVAAGITAKLIRRHPHVFGDVEVSGAEEVLVNWERIKAEEKGEKPVEDDIPATLPALARAAKVQRRAAGWGFEWRSTEAAMAKLHEELSELESATGDEAEDELGDVLFAAVSVARRLGVDAESALRRSTRRFAERYERMREQAREQGIDLSGAYAAGLAGRVWFTGRLDHRYAPAALSVSEVLVVPSVLDEAFGMVAAEGAAAGALPLVARHSGLAEVAETLETATGRPGLFSFEPGRGAVERLADGMNRLLRMPDREREELRERVVETVRREWTWERTADHLLAAMAS